MMKHFSLSICIGLAIGLCGHSAAAQSTANFSGNFQLHSSAFTNGSNIPLSLVLNNEVNGVNTCSASGAAGGDTSPELHWTNAPQGTQSFVVVLYDVTAGFTHWGMYNIRGNATGLPAGAGVAGSAYGQQIMNDFYLGNEYDGPCPPAGVAPDAHQYVFTVYALSNRLELPGSANFPANSEMLFDALVQDGKQGKILASASLTGYYSSTPSN